MATAAAIGDHGGVSSAPPTAPVAGPSPGGASPGGPSAHPRRISVGDMVRSMAVVLLFVAGLVLVVQRQHRDPVQTVEIAAPVAKARQVAAYPVLAPTGLGPGWRPTSVRLSRPAGQDEPAVALHVGYVTPGGEYAALEESDAPDRARFVDAQTGGGAGQGSEMIGGAAWERYAADRPTRRSLVLRRGSSVVVVTGTAGFDELRTLAASLVAS